MKKIKLHHYILLFMILIAAFLRLWNLDQADVITDEALYGFRSIGYIDFVASEFQKTPYDWYGFEGVPSWVKLSFHDHPPLVFIIQHVFFKIGGVNLWTLRLPFVFFGIVSVYLVYLIGKILFEGIKKVKKVERVNGKPLHSHDYGTMPAWRQVGIPLFSKGRIVGLTAAGLLAVNSYHVWVSRIGLQESIVIFFILLTVYLFLRSLQDQKYFLLTGGALGLALLTKYTSVILIPIFITYLILFKRSVFKKKYIYQGLLIAFVLFLPVIVYNLKLLFEFGHFDFQLSYLLGQEVSDWQHRLGRDLAGSFSDRVTALFPSIWRGVTLVFGVLSLASVIAGSYKVMKNKRQEKQGIIFILVVLVWILFMLLGFGPNERFSSIIIPFVVLLISIVFVPYIIKLTTFIASPTNKVKSFLFMFLYFCIFCIFVTYELFFTYNTALAAKKFDGKKSMTYSELKHESLSWGYNELNTYFDQNLFSEYYPALQFPQKYIFLERLKAQALDIAKKQGKKPKKAMIIYDFNMDPLATVWYIFRPSIYHAWPMLTADTYLQTLQQEGENFFRDQGMSEFYFVKASDNTLFRIPNTATTPTIGAQRLEMQLVEEGIEAEYIMNKRIGKTFRVYRFE